MQRYLRDPMFSRFYTILDRHTHRHTTRAATAYTALA